MFCFHFNLSGFFVSWTGRSPVVRHSLFFFSEYMARPFFFIGIIFAMVIVFSKSPVCNNINGTTSNYTEESKEGGLHLHVRYDEIVLLYMYIIMLSFLSYSPVAWFRSVERHKIAQLKFYSTTRFTASPTDIDIFLHDTISSTSYILHYFIALTGVLIIGFVKLLILNSFFNGHFTPLGVRVFQYLVGSSEYNPIDLLMPSEIVCDGDACIPMALFIAGYHFDRQCFLPHQLFNKIFFTGYWFALFISFVILIGDTFYKLVYVSTTIFKRKLHQQVAQIAKNLNEANGDSYRSRVLNPDIEIRRMARRFQCTFLMFEFTNFNITAFIDRVKQLHLDISVQV